MHAVIPTSGNPIIDDGHRELARRVAEIGQLWKLGAPPDELQRRADALSDYAHRHFAQEMLILRAHGVATEDLGHNHGQLVEEIERLVEDAVAGRARWIDVVDALERLLFDHEILEDSRFFASLAPLADGALVEWGADLAIGIEWIDQHHRSLVETVNELAHCSDPSTGHDLLIRLRRHAAHHFKDEEAKLVGSAGAEAHGLGHRHLLDALDELIAKAETSKIDHAAIARDYLHLWLVEHIRETDCRDFSPDHAAKT